jgi:hypothetical protein
MMRAFGTPQRGQTMPEVRFAIGDTPYIDLDTLRPKKDA